MEANMKTLHPAIPVAFVVAAALCSPACDATLLDPFSQAVADSSLDRPPEDPSPNNRRILIDASRDGGVWWFPQSGPFDPAEPHQGEYLAEYLRSLGYGVDELGRNQEVTAELLDGYSMVIRAGEWGRAPAEELHAYERFLQRPVTLVLLSDHRLTDPTDELAESLGVKFGGAVDGPITILADHPIVRGIKETPYLVGAAVTDYDPERVEVLAQLADSTAVMGLIRSDVAKIFFCGDTNTLELVPLPLVDNLLAWGFESDD
jgi:hypothetical protein